MSKLGSRIKKLREAANMSLQDVATRAALSKAHVWELETGSPNPTIKTICCVAVALDVDPAELAALAAEDCRSALQVETRTQSFVVASENSANITTGQADDK